MSKKAEGYNLKNSAVKRIMQEIKEVQEDNSGEFIAEALEDDIFEWHFVMRGAPDSEFEGGIYHGRILLPAEYPFKPPAFMMLSPTGRFETNVKICLSISSHHPEMWQASWSVRTALTALVAFMPTPGAGALGSLDFSKEERAKLAAASRLAPPKFGTPERQQLIEDMHRRMLEIDARPRGIGSSGNATGGRKRGGGSGAAAAAEARAAAAGAEPPAAPASPQAARLPQAAQSLQQQRGGDASGPHEAQQQAQQRQGAAPAAGGPQPAARPPPSSLTDWGLNVVAGILIAMVLAILVRKFLNATAGSSSAA